MSDPTPPVTPPPGFHPPELHERQELVGRDLRTEEMVFNMGPQHPATHGVLRLLLTIDGEIIKKVESEKNDSKNEKSKFAVGGSARSQQTEYQTHC